jgi:hypothetical protein
VAGNALNQRIVDAVSGELVVRRQQFEDRRFLEDQVRTFGNRRARQTG